jgi:hypothetical protein
LRDRHLVRDDGVVNPEDEALVDRICESYFTDGWRPYKTATKGLNPKQRQKWMRRYVQHQQGGKAIWDRVQHGNLTVRRAYQRAQTKDLLHNRADDSANPKVNRRYRRKLYGPGWKPGARKRLRARIADGSGKGRLAQKKLDRYNRHRTRFLKKRGVRDPWRKRKVKAEDGSWVKPSFYEAMTEDIFEEVMAVWEGGTREALVAADRIRDGLLEAAVPAPSAEPEGFIRSRRGALL